MPDFHDPQTREQMEREGWEMVRTVSPPPRFAYQKKDIKLRIIAIWDDYILDIGKTSRDGTPMKSFAAALNAANAILEGVEG